MTTSQLVLEYVKVLVWPTVAAFLVLYFRSGRGVLVHLADRLQSAENIKFGLMGQEIELSGTAKALLSEKPHLPEQALQRLNSPFADIVGIALLDAPSKTLPEDELLPIILRAVGGVSISPDQQGFVATSLLRQLEPVIKELEAQHFVLRKDGGVSLTPDGVSFFSRVRENQLKAVASIRRHGALQ